MFTHVLPDSYILIAAATDDVHTLCAACRLLAWHALCVCVCVCATPHGAACVIEANGTVHGSVQQHINTRACAHRQRLSPAVRHFLSCISLRYTQTLTRTHSIGRAQKPPTVQSVQIPTLSAPDQDQPLPSSHLYPLSRPHFVVTLLPSIIYNGSHQANRTVSRGDMTVGRRCP